MKKFSLKKKAQRAKLAAKKEEANKKKQPKYGRHRTMTTKQIDTKKLTMKPAKDSNPINPSLEVKK